MIRRTLIFSLILLAIYGILFSKLHMSTENAINREMALREIRPVSSKVIKPFLLGHEAFYADVFWIDTIQLSVEKDIINQFEYLQGMINLVVDLDPRFEQVYIWANTVLPYAKSKTASYEEKIRGATAILQKGWKYSQNDTEGWKHFDRHWMIPQNLAYNYGIELKEPEKALEYTRALLNIPGIPPVYKTWVAHVYKDDSNAKESVSYLNDYLAAETLLSQLNMTEDEDAKAKLRAKLIFFTRKVDKNVNVDAQIEAVRKRIQSLVQAWKDQYAFIPFQLYVLLHNNVPESETMKSEAIYDVFFPNLSSTQLNVGE